MTLFQHVKIIINQLSSHLIAVINRKRFVITLIVHLKINRRNKVSLLKKIFIDVVVIGYRLDVFKPGEEFLLFCDFIKRSFYFKLIGIFYSL